MAIKIYYQNIRGGNLKAPKIKRAMSSLYFDLVFLVETWFQEGFNSAEIVPAENYEIFRQDRDLLRTRKKTGGGILIAARKGLKVTRRKDLESPSLEQIWLVLHSTTPIYICCAYLPDRSATLDYLAS